MIFLLVNNKMDESEGEEGGLESTLKIALEQCVALARKKIRSKKGINQLQALLIDYRSNTQLAAIVLQVVRLISLYESGRKEQGDETNDSVPLEEYNQLQQRLQKSEAAVRDHIKVRLLFLKNQQQLKMYCDQLEEKNQELLKSNQDLLASTNHIINSLKRDNQILTDENHKLREKQPPTLTYGQPQKEARPASRDSRELPSKGTPPRQNSRQSREESIMSSIKKARKLIDSQNGSSVKKDPSSTNDPIKQKRNSLASSIKPNK